MGSSRAENGRLEVRAPARPSDRGPSAPRRRRRHQRQRTPHRDRAARRCCRLRLVVPPRPPTRRAGRGHARRGRDRLTHGPVRPCPYGAQGPARPASTTIDVEHARHRRRIDDPIEVLAEPFVAHHGRGGERGDDLVSSGEVAVVNIHAVDHTAQNAVGPRSTTSAPPSMKMTWPVVFELAGLASQTISSATSSGSPYPPSGIGTAWASISRPSAVDV